MHPMIVADPESKNHLGGNGRFAPLAGLVAIVIGASVAGPTGAAIGMIALFLLLEFSHNTAGSRHWAGRENRD